MRESGCENASWRSETSWVIRSGSLENSFTFDSSDDSPPASPRNPTPLLLNPPSHHSGPCEIKLYFSQRYSIRQIYVRSTARVYEVYHSASDYLCTARCCIAEREQGVLRPKFAKESSEDDAKCHGKELVQDYYEATVEINESEPCASVTIRLLSLQCKQCVLVDEMYIFAELVGPIESVSSAPYATNSAGSSLMTMLLPTLLQLSKSGSSALQAESVSGNLGKVNEVEILSKATELSDVVPQILEGEPSKEVQQYVKSKDSEIMGKVNKVEILSKESDLTDTVSEAADNQSVKLHNLDKYSKEPFMGQHQNNSHNLTEDESSFNPVVTRSPPHGRIEEVLEQLLSRVSKIEEVCLRFEENMLKPLNRMEMRIQRVEEQLESLSKRPQCTGLPAGARFAAPSFSCDTSSSSNDKDGSDSVSSKIPELDKNESDASSVLLNPGEVILESVKALTPLPGLVVSAPDFSCAEDDEGEDDLEDASVSNLTKGSSEGKSKRLIDDILAAALSNFLPSPSDNPLEGKQTAGNQCNAAQAIGSTESSQIMETLANHGIAQYIELPSEEATTPVARTLTVRGSFLDLSLFDENKAPHSGCSGFSAVKSKDFDQTDYCKLVDESSQSSSSILLSPGKDATERNLRCSMDVDSDTERAVAVAEGSDRVFDSKTAPSEDDMAWMNVEFTCDAHSSVQLPLEALLGDGTSIPELDFPANSSGGGEKMIDPLISRHLLVDLGIYGIVGNSDEESELNNHTTSSSNSNSKPEMLASLI